MSQKSTCQVQISAPDTGGQSCAWRTSGSSRIFANLFYKRVLKDFLFLVFSPGTPKISQYLPDTIVFSKIHQVQVGLCGIGVGTGRGMCGVVGDASMR